MCAPHVLGSVNKDLKAAGKAVITPSARMGRGSLVRVQASSLDSPHVTYGAVSSDNNTGLLAGSPRSSPVPADAPGSYTIDLPNAGTAVLT